MHFHWKKSISYDDVLSVVGVVNDEFMTNFIDSMLSRNVETVLQNVSRLIVEGRDAAHFTSDLVVYFRNLLICRSTGGKCDDLIEVPTEVLNTMKQQAEKISMEEIMYHIRELSALENSLKYAANPRVLLEVTLIKLCRGSSVPARIWKKGWRQSKESWKAENLWPDRQQVRIRQTPFRRMPAAHRHLQAKLFLMTVQKIKVPANQAMARVPLPLPLIIQPAMQMALTENLPLMISAMMREKGLQAGKTLRSEDQHKRCP